MSRFLNRRQAALPSRHFHSILLIVFSSLSACTTIANTVGTELDLNTVRLREALQASNPPAASDVQAQGVDRQILAMQRLYTDPMLQRRVESMLNRLVSHSHKKGLRFTLRIIDSPVRNAFVTGGRFVYVYTGLLQDVQSEDELAAILSHEIAHVDAGHVARTQRSLLWTNLGLLLAGALTKGDTADAIIRTAGQLIPAGYSRQHEREADILGVIYAHRAGYDPRRINDFFQRSWVEEERIRSQLESQLRAAQYTLSQKLAAYRYAEGRYRTYPNNQTYQMVWATYRDGQGAQAAFDRALSQYQAFMANASPLFRTHPVNAERMNTVLAVAQYASGQRGLESFPPSSMIYRTIAALNEVEFNRGAPQAQGDPR